MSIYTKDLFKKESCTVLLAIVLSAITFRLKAQDIAPSIAFNPQTYVCYKATDTLTIDGRLNEKSWNKAAWTKSFVDIEGPSKSKPRFRTRTKMLWDENYLYIAAKLEEPQVWAKLTKRDAVIFHDNDFEVFIDPDGDTHHYYELEINALNTVWDLMLTKPYRDGGQPIDYWDIRGLKSSVNINGTLNDPTDIDSGWTLELALPWDVLEETAPEGRPPKDGEQWRINFSRVEWQANAVDGSYKKKTDTETGEPIPEDNWVWSPQGIVNMHYPEMWGFVQFSAKEVGTGTGPFAWQKKEYVKWYLRRLYYRQQEYKNSHHSFTQSLEKLNALSLFDEMKLDKKLPDLTAPVLQATANTFEIMVRNKTANRAWYIREDGKVWSYKMKN